MTIFQSLIRKEALHIIRDRRTMIITLIMPLVLLLLFGFAISTEINNVRVVAVIDRYTPQTRDIVEKLRTNEYFTFEGTVAETDVADMMRRGDTDAGKKKNFCGSNLRPGSRDPRYRIYGRIHICRDSTDASHCSLHCSGRSGILRMDPALFCLQEDSGKRDKKDYAADRREIR